jgi:hypothetical protein
MELLKTILSNKELLAEIRKLGTPIVLVILGFALGYKTASTPTKDRICGKELATLKANDLKIGNYEAQIKKLRIEVSRCEDTCTERVNTEADIQKVKCSEEKAKAKEQQKKNLTKFTCAKCKKRGYCK